MNRVLLDLIIQASQFDEGIDWGTLCTWAKAKGIPLTKAEAKDYLKQARAEHWGSEPSPNGDGAEPPQRKLPEALTLHELTNMAEPDREYLIDPIIPKGNLLIAAYPKSGKTFFALATAVALASGQPFLGRFTVPHRRRVGLIMLEDQPHRIRRRLRRICQGLGIELNDLEGYLHFWFRPTGFQFHDSQMMSELRHDSEALDLDLLLLDHFSLAAEGDFDSASEVAPQLEAYRVSAEPGSAGLIAHAKKLQEKQSSDLRLTDLIRNSSAFGAWYDAGIVLSRQNENAPIQVRIELRDDRSPDPFMVEMTDQYPAYTDEHGNYQRAAGWLRFNATTLDPVVAEQTTKGERFITALLQFVSENPGCSKNKIRMAIKGANSDIDSGLRLCVQRNLLKLIEAETGRGWQYWPLSP